MSGSGGDYDHCAVLFIFSKQPGGEFPGITELAQLAASAMAAQDGIWVAYAVDGQPPAPAPAPTPKRWKVATSACNIRSSPVAPANNIVGTAKQGDVFTQVGVALGWVQVQANPDRWISQSVLTSV